ncbi:MAG: oligosaccharide flippase family protein [Firmicutes bacterium]|nr:oligosaccharide flippase family protein [Bacillota bacterium]
MFFRLLKQKLVKDFFTYTFFSALQKAIPFLLLPFFSRYFSEIQLGYFIVFQTIVLLAMPIMTLCVDTAIGINYYHYNFQKFSKYLTNNLIFAGVWFFVVFLIIFLFNGWFSIVLNFPALWLLLGLATVFPQFVFQLRQLLFRYQNKPLSYGLFSLGSALLNNGLGFIFLYFTPFTWEAFVLGYLIGYVFIAVISVILMNKDKFLLFSFHIKMIGNAIKIGAPVMIHTIGSWLSTSLNRILINTLIGTAATASFGIGASFGMIMTLVQDSMNLAYTPFLFEKLKNYNVSTQQILVKTTLLIYLLIVVSAFAISIIGYFGISFIFGELYLSTQQFIFPLVIAAAVNGCYKVHVNYLFYSKKTWTIAQITLLCGFINIALLYSMIKVWGIMGAVYASLLIQIFSYLLITYKAHKLYPLNFLFHTKSISKHLFSKGK